MSGEGEAGRDKLEIDNMFLCGSRFTRVSLKGAEFRDTHLIDAVIDDVNATGLRFENVNLSGAQFGNVIDDWCNDPRCQAGRPRRLPMRAFRA